VREIVMLRHAVSASALLAVTACMAAHQSPPSAPTAMRGLSTSSPPGVLRTAARELVAAGFVVTQSDSVARLRAEREHPPGELEGRLTCRSGLTPKGRAVIAPTMILDLSVLPRSEGGSELLVASRVSTAYLRLAADPPRRATEDDCRSTGNLERRLLESLAAEHR
jgi:hypothetical protein